MVKPMFVNKQKEKEKGQEKQKETKIEFLSKKRIEPDTPKDDVDMVKLKKKVNEIMYSICEEKNKKEDDLDILYNSMSKEYLLNEFNTNCLNYINKIITDVQKNHLKKFQGIFELNKIFISIIKELLMNEFEILLLSLYLEVINISISEDIISFKENLFFICFFIKKLTISPEKLSPINSFLIRKYQGFDDKFNKWFESNSSIINNNIYFNYAKINQRFKEFNKPYSIFCKNNYLDYNLIIDRILTMSIPYNESRGENASLSKKILIDNNNLNVSNNIFLQNKNNNMNQNYLFENNNKINFNSNDLKNYYSSLIPTYPTGAFMNQNNKNINLGYLYNNNANILSQLNSLNNGQIGNTFVNNQNLQIEEQKNKGNIKFNLIKENNNANINMKNSEKKESNEDNANPKKLFVTQVQNSMTNTKNENKDNNEINNDEYVSNLNSEKVITPNNLLYTLKSENQNDQDIDNTQNIIKQKNGNNNDKMNNNIVKNNNTINLYQNNLLGLNISQQMNDLNTMKYNINNLGINDLNSSSQLSFFSLKNPLYGDLNNFYNNPFQGLDAENYKLLLNPSQNFLKSYILNSSSKNFYPNINNYNFANTNNISENGNNNNVNIPVNHILIGNSVLPNLNNISQSNENSNGNNLTPEQNNENNVNKDSN